MNYSTPERIVEIWPSRFNLTGGNGKLNAHDYTRNAEKLANEVYANRMGNGNQASGDGYHFRGGGFIQLTGRGSYKKYAEYVDRDIEFVGTQVKLNDEWAMDSAAWEYVIDKNLLGVSDIITITKRINGGLIGLAERRKYFQRALEVLV